MQVSNKGSSLRHSEYAVLRWFEGQQLQEECVEIVNNQVCKTVIRSPFELVRETKVTLIGKDYTAQGIVEASQSESKCFLLTLASRGFHRDIGSSLDPGTLSVDDFFGEDQEAAILAEIAEETLVQQALSDLTSDALEGPSPWQTLQPDSTQNSVLRH